MNRMYVILMGFLLSKIFSYYFFESIFKYKIFLIIESGSVAQNTWLKLLPRNWYIYEFTLFEHSCWMFGIYFFLLLNLSKCAQVDEIYYLIRKWLPNLMEVAKQSPKVVQEIHHQKKWNVRVKLDGQRHTFAQAMTVTRHLI